MAFGIFHEVMISPPDLFALLAHDTRLRCMLLLLAYKELCVCDLTAAIGASSRTSRAIWPSCARRA